MKKWNKIFKQYLIMDANYLINYISKFSNPAHQQEFLFPHLSVLNFTAYIGFNYEFYT